MSAPLALSAASAMSSIAESLRAAINPTGVAVVGASEDTAGAGGISSS